jgi:hypothetical protein
MFLSVSAVLFSLAYHLFNTEKLYHTISRITIPHPMTLHQNSPLIKQYLSALELFNPETTPAKAREGRRERASGSQGLDVLGEQ